VVIEQEETLVSAPWNRATAWPPPQPEYNICSVGKMLSPGLLNAQVFSSFLVWQITFSSGNLSARQ
jgi:hypothetical protein